MTDPINLTQDEWTLLSKIAQTDGTSERQALHDAIVKLHKATFFLAPKVDYTTPAQHLA